MDVELGPMGAVALGEWSRRSSQAWMDGWPRRSGGACVSVVLRWWGHVVVMCWACGDAWRDYRAVRTCQVGGAGVFAGGRDAGEV